MQDSFVKTAAQVAAMQDNNDQKQPEIQWPQIKKAVTDLMANTSGMNIDTLEQLREECLKMLDNMKQRAIIDRERYALLNSYDNKGGLTAPST
jgi:hypothetical protein